jgi:hypothetical protein
LRSAHSHAKRPPFVTEMQRKIPKHLRGLALWNDWTEV